MQAFGQNMQKENLLEVGDVEEAIKAAESVSDDRLQSLVKGYAVSR